MRSFRYVFSLFKVLEQRPPVARKLAWKFAFGSSYHPIYIIAACIFSAIGEWNSYIHPNIGVVVSSKLRNRLRASKRRRVVGLKWPTTSTGAGASIPIYL